LHRKGFDGAFGRRLPIHIARLGLSDVGAEGTQIILVGGTPSVEWARPTLARLRHLLLEDEGSLAVPVPLRGAVGRRLEGLDRLLADPEFVYLVPTMVSAWGRRPDAP